jgi:hypothetical protein
VFAVARSERLTPPRLRALELVTGEQVLHEIMTVIVGGLPAPGQAQFLRDLDTYGLLEAVVYFHSYPRLEPEFLEAACALCERIAADFDTHADEIATSDDPNVAAQLRLLALVGDNGHVVRRFKRTPRQAPDGIADPVAPSRDDEYERRLPASSDLAELMGYLGGMPRAGNLAEELSEHIHAAAMFEGFPGVQAMFFNAADLVEQHGVDVFGPVGQHILLDLVNATNEELFGDYDGWIECLNCAGEWYLKPTLEAVNDALLRGEWWCDSCRQLPE